MKELCCVCKKETAIWLYLPGRYGESYCDNCVSRGCTCNHHYIKGERADPPPMDHSDWKWIEENEVWSDLDSLGREYPCCEYMYEEDGWEKENEK